MNFKRVAKVGAVCLAFYAGGAFILSKMMSYKNADIEPGKSYSILMGESDNVLFPFFGSKTYFSARKAFDGENVTGYQMADINKRGVSKKFRDDDLDGKIDSIELKECGISIKLTRADNFETHGEEFTFGDAYLHQTRERFKDFISEVEREAGFSK
jgi:hypothetical protein